MAESSHCVHESPESLLLSKVVYVNLIVAVVV